MLWIRSQCSVILQSPARQSSAGRLNIYQISLVRRLKYYPHCILQERGKKTGSRIQTFVFKNLNLFWLQPACRMEHCHWCYPYPVGAKLKIKIALTIKLSQVMCRHQSISSPGPRQRSPGSISMEQPGLGWTCLKAATLTRISIHQRRVY